MTTKAGAPPHNNSTQILCYGCGSLGFIRSNCKCSGDSNGVSKESVAAVEFLCSSFIIDNCSPLVPISILKHAGYAYLDTGATTIIAVTAIVLQDDTPIAAISHVK